VRIGVESKSYYGSAWSQAGLASIPGGGAEAQRPGKGVEAGGELKKEIESQVRGMRRLIPAPSPARLNQCLGELDRAEGIRRRGSGSAAWRFYLTKTRLTIERENAGSE